jgi:hypothetical protein
MAEQFAPLEERRISATDLRPLPRTERRHGAPDTRKPEKLKASLWRVNYFGGNGAPLTALVVAIDGDDAAAFLGVVDSSGVQVVRDRYPVEVVGVDKAHDPLKPMPINVAPLEPSKQLTDAELAALRAMLGTKGPVYQGPERRKGAVDIRPMPRVERRKK